MIHAGWLEFVWAMVGFSGLMAALLNASGARADMLKFRHSPLEDQRFLTHIIYISSCIIVAKHLVVVTVALWSVTHPPPPPDQWLLPQSLISTIGWTCVSLLMTTSAVMGIRWRRQLAQGAYGTRYRSIGRRSDDGKIAARTHTTTTTTTREDNSDCSDDPPTSNQ